jgi:hypothetical protein
MRTSYWTYYSFYVSFRRVVGVGGIFHMNF